MVFNLAFSIGAAALRSGVSIHTLRYYEKIGLLAEVDRNKAGRRTYSSDDLDWILLLRCLRKSGMAIADMVAFSKLVRSNGGIPARIDLLARHRKHVEASLLDLQNALGVIDEKLVRYQKINAETEANTSEVRT